jgi:hypothetical protein
MTARIRIYLRRHHIALLALFLAIGGTSYAAVKLPTNSVATKQIKNGQVKAADLSKDAITSAKVKDLTLQARDFAPGQLPAGPAGAQGKPGADGAPATKLFLVSDESGNVVASSGLKSQNQVFVKPGVYNVPFDRDVSNCARIATIGGATVGDGGQAEFITTELVSLNTVRVDITQAGAAGIPVAVSFSLAVFC